MKILLVHRERHADVSLPKGKVDPGESLPATAAREVSEEAGIDIVLGRPLGTTGYTMQNGRDKIVHYWTARVGDDAHVNSRFVSNEEISDLEWLSLSTAKKALSYERDIELVERFEAMLERDEVDTFAIIALRHAKALPAGAWDGPDATRPLLHRGTVQARDVVGGLTAFGPVKLVSSTATRCLQTIAPLAQALGLPVKETDAISQDHYDGASVAKGVARRLGAARSAVLCSHGPVLPEIVGQLAEQTGSPMTHELRDASALSTGEYSVFHMATADGSPQIVAVETHGAPVL